MTDGILIRPAQPSDARELVELARAVTAEPEGWLLSTDARSVGEERRYLRALRHFADACVYVAEGRPGEIVARLSLARDLHPASRHVADVGLMVAQKHRRRRIGWSLLEEAVGWADRVGVRKLELHVFPHNEPAIALYERFGFRREGYRRAHYLRGSGGYVDAILMAYDVS
ncbi:MAG: GNAT family N-acetyltransferase [Actinomycetota bacterium]|nr:GNAT family N-acetyltransferase [Actinomycetota bacterium]